MGSRIMHLIIANQIADKISVTDKHAFLLGGIAPDAISPKELSHFFEGDGNDYSRSIAYEKFLQKYSDHHQSDYILGYYTHLIADDIWLKGFFLPWLKNRMENDPEIFNRYHHDFRLLNGKLLYHYGIEPSLVDGLDKNDTIFDLDEVTANEVRAFVPYVKEDMNFPQDDLDMKLSVFTMEQIIGYIETSVDKSLKVMEKSLI